jgi:NAD(P)-dependent dehydrogenase (short-subunit alcohol dehydrogenase family)
VRNRTFEGKTAIVTGAGRGIGFEIARELAAEGAGVILNDIDEAALNEAAAAIINAGGQCRAVHGSSAELPVIQAMVDTAVATFGRLDVVIANAGITLFGNFLEYAPESFREVLNVNLGGSFFLAQRAARQMVQQGGGGSILFMSSVTGHQAHKQLAAYGMTKAGLEMLAKTLVVELSAFGINVNAVAPGATLTERTKEDEAYERTWSGITPMGRPATTADIANAALFLVSAASKHITGQTIVIDGGWTSVSPSPF